MVETSEFIHIHPSDNVAVAVHELAAGSLVEVAGQKITLSDLIPAGHKFAIRDIPQGEKVMKYGFPIGYAVSPIKAGSHIHSHNLKTLLKGTEIYDYKPIVNDIGHEDTIPTFDGYVRPDGNVGIRNEIWIVPTVGCVNGICENLVKRSARLLGSNSSVDGVFAFPHPFGCSQLGGDHENTRKILAGLVKHPNAAGILVVALGCENNTMESFKEILGPLDSKRVKFMLAQDAGDEFEEGERLLKELIEETSKAKRTPVPISKLRVGLKCGASDGFSGITANPLLGAFSDYLVSCGGTTVLSEVPEMFGAETILMERCVSPEIFDKCVNMINGFKEYFLRYNQPVYENPSPGNKKGGITTLEEKSLGCTQKGGSGPVVDVLEYGDLLAKPGLNLLKGPGNDIVAATALAASGVHMVLFTTGRGTPLGSPVPTVKISTNSDLAKRKPNWIDFNAGRLLEGMTMRQVRDEFIKYLIDVASGREYARNEKNGFREIAIFKDGVTL